jgi:fatty-acyl-CoA synthase
VEALTTEIAKKTLGEMLDRLAAEYPDREALVHFDNKVRYTYSQLKERVDLLARGMMALGIESGEHVSVWCTNYPQWVEAQFALAKIGAALVTVNIHYRTLELEYLLDQSDSSTLIMMRGFRDANFVEMVNKICPELPSSKPGRLHSKRFPHLKRVIMLDEERYPGMLNWDSLYQLGEEVSQAELEARQSQVKPDDTVTLMYTSGTTGFPKGVMLSHMNIVANGTYIGDCMKLTGEDRVCIPVPFFHCFGSVLGMMATMTHSGTMVVLDYFHAKSVLEAVSQERCTALHGVPTMFIAELHHPDFEKYDLTSLRTGIMAGSPCPIEVMRAVIEKMGMREITIAYGQTESSPVITQTRTDDPVEVRVSTVGRALPNVEVKIVDMETGEDLPAGVQGELCTRGFHVMKGYYKKSEETAQAIDEQGWLYTGDLAMMDEHGYFKITGRLKDMIIRGGENIYPREIEEFLYAHPKVLDAQVIGIPSEKYGEEVMAWVILKPGERATSEELIAYFRGRISHFKVPKFIKFIDEFPMTASGKIQKFKLQELAIAELGLELAAKVETA